MKTHNGTRNIKTAKSRKYKLDSNSCSTFILPKGGRIESANTNFTSEIQNKTFFSNFSPNKINNNVTSEKLLKNSNYNKSSNNFFDSTDSLIKNNNKILSFKPRWKYSYSIDKNDILTLQFNTQKNNAFKFVDYKDIDKKPEKIVYSWTKPRMIRIIENNKKIEEEIKSNPWKYSYLFNNLKSNGQGKLTKLLMNQLSSPNMNQRINNNNNRINYNVINDFDYINDIFNQNDKNIKNQKKNFGFKKNEIFEQNNKYEPIKFRNIY